MVGVIVCQHCEEVIEHYEDEKVSVLYGICPHCQKERGEENNQ